MSLKKFEKWILSQKLKPRRFIFPADRLLYKLGYTGPPLIYKSYPKLALILSLYWFIFFPLVSVVAFGLIMQDRTWFYSLRADVFSLSFLLFGTSIFFGFTTAYFIKRTAEKHSISDWQDFLGD